MKDVIPTMSKFEMKMEGLDELRAKLDSYANKVGVTNTALEKAAEHLRGAIANSVTVRTGALKAAIIKGEVKNGKVLIGPSQQGPAFRAHFVEFGTKYMTAKPFMRPTFQREKKTIEKIMADEIRKGLGL